MTKPGFLNSFPKTVLFSESVTQNMKILTTNDFLS